MRLTTKLANLFVIATIVFSLFFQNFQPAQASTPAQDTGVRTGYNGRTGKLSFVGTDPANPVTVKAAQNPSFSAKERGLALIAPYASQFGLKDVQKELTLRSTKQVNKLEVTRYQQTYQGIPVMGGELVLNATPKGGLVALSGEVSPDLALDVTPTIDAARASETALQAVAKWNKMTADALTTSAPELWIYDPRLLSPEGNTPELVWRMEVTPKDGLTPIRELVLVNAKRGNIALHFNQVDTAWQGQRKSSPSQLFSASIQPAEQRTTAAPIDLTQPQTLSDVQAQTSGTTWYVATTGNDANSCTDTSTPCLTINGAIGKAAGGDTIKVATGTYTGTGTEVVLISKSITFSGGWNAAFTTQTGTSIIDGQNARRGVSVSATTSLERFIIVNGNAKAVNLNGLGGGVYILADVSITFTNSSIQNNLAQVGGGIYKTSGSLSLTLNNTTVSNNSAFNGGGIEYDGGSLILNNSTINTNSASSVGGGIYVYSTSLTLNNSTISNNLAGYIGGGIFIHTANLTSNNGTISNNSATDSGGGIYIQAGTGSSVSLKNSILGDNFSQSSPNCSGSLTSSGNNIISNISGCSITAASGDKFNVNPILGTFLPVQGYHPLLPGSPAINAGNSVTCLPTDQRGMARIGTCDIGAYEYTAPGTAANLSVVSGGGQRTPPNFAFAKPLKAVALDSQGSPVPNVNIAFAAPASGASGIFANSGINTSSTFTDMSGIATTSTFTANNQFGTYNVSASGAGLSPVGFSLENAGWYVSTSGNDSNSCSVPASPCQTLNGAISKASAEDTIVVAAGTYTGTSSYVITISKSLHLSGGWNPSFITQTGTSTIDGQNSRQGVLTAGGVTIIAVMERFAIINGHSGSGGEGGGIYNGGMLTLNNVTLSNNIVPYGYGGGIHNSSAGILTLNNVTLSNNSAGFGGGIYNYYGTLTSKNTLIGGNSASSNGPDCYGTINASEHSLVGNVTDCTVASGPGNLLNVNPMLGTFVPVQGYYPLQLGSPAIDSGNPVTCLATDQLGIARPQGASCDIGAIEYVFNHSASLLLTTYNAQNSTVLPGVKICDQTDLTCAAGDTDAKKAHQYAAGVYDFYKIHHNRNSLDNNGIEIISSVHYGSGYDNAFWNGYMMIYGDGYPAADDIVAHELTHGVTQYESNLYYYYQSGAISESFSDLWGELYDQSNGMGNDSAAVKWQIGEDAPGGAFRSMSNPPAFGDPDAITSPNYFTGWQDSGGVHTNSGVNNKAAFLMVDGGVFNGKAVTALGADKTLAIYYEVQTNLLTSGSDYADLYNALYQACLNLVGTKGITSADCQAVRNATDAVAMNAQPTSNSNFNTDAPLCDPDKMYKGDLFFDDLESGAANWTFNNGAKTRWQYGSPYEVYAHSGTGFLYADDSPAATTDATATLKPVAIPANAYLDFAHAYDFEYDASGYYDGGVLEYSTNGGATWQDAGALMQYNGYKGPIYTGYGNPLSGRSAFVMESHGYISTRLNLSSLAGKNVSFRWRMGLDTGGYYMGWYLDDVRIYTCAPAPDTTITSKPDSLTDQTSATFAFTSTKPGSTFACSLDGAPYSACTSPQSYPGLSYAAHTFSVRATDTDGVTDPTPASYAWTISPLASINVYIGTNATPVGSYSLFKSQSARVNYAGVNNGPLKITSTNGTPIIAALRDAWQANGVWTSFAQLMGLPASQVSDTYYFPAYNNISLDEQLRFGNVGTADTTVTVTIGGLVKGSYFLHPGESARVNYAGVNSGPVIVKSSGNVSIIAAERDAWQWNGVWYSFVQLMGLPASQLSDTYYFPAYNNISLDEQLRFGNVGTADTTVTVTIGGQVKGSYFLHPNESARVNYAGVNSGPVVVQSSDGVPIIVAERDAWQTNGVWTSFAQTMGLPVSQVSDTYVFPAYNNISLDEQLRFGNVGTADTTVTVTIGGQPMGSYFLHPSESARVNYAGVNSGPVVVKSSGNVAIIAAERDAWQWNGVWYSFVQTMGLPAGQLSDTYVFPAYNNISLDEQLRFGVP